MGRQPGARNRDYERTRHELALRCAAALLREDGEPATFADLARAAGVSATTLAHYFGDRDGVFTGAMAAVASDGRAYTAAGPEVGDTIEDTVAMLSSSLVAAWRRFGLGRVVTSGLARGLSSQVRGPAYLGGVLEPVLGSVEAALAVHVARGDLPQIDVREAALSVISPVVLALLHQDGLGGSTARPLDVEGFARRHARLVCAGLQHLDR